MCTHTADFGWLQAGMGRLGRRTVLFCVCVWFRGRPRFEDDADCKRGGGWVSVVRLKNWVECRAGKEREQDSNASADIIVSSLSLQLFFISCPRGNWILIELCCRRLQQQQQKKKKCAILSVCTGGSMSSTRPATRCHFAHTWINQSVTTQTWRSLAFYVHLSLLFLFFLLEKKRIKETVPLLLYSLFLYSFIFKWRLGSGGVQGMPPDMTCVRHGRIVQDQTDRMLQQLPYPIMSSKATTLVE